MLLAGVMALSLTACGGGDSDKGKKESGKEMKVAMVTDSGDITDQSFNQTTYESGKAWSEDNDVELLITNRKVTMMRREKQALIKLLQMEQM